MNTDDRDRGLRLLGMWPGPVDVVAAAASRREATAALAELQATAKSAVRLVARKLHPDLAGPGREADLRAVLVAGDWIAGLKVADVWRARPRGGRRLHRPGSPIELEVSVARVRITWRGSRGP